MKRLDDIKKEFPIFERTINGKPLVYLDNASTTQKPRGVISALSDFYSLHNANIHRGIHALSEEATERYEQTRKTVARFINAEVPEEIVFTRNCTESINLVARTWGEMHIGRGDEIIVSALEHHANLVPWQVLCMQKKAKLLVIPLTSEHELDMAAYEKLLSKKTRMVCVTAQSNVLGVCPDLKDLIKKAHARKALVLVDGAQSVGHRRTNVQALDCDFFAFSAHKMLGPTGVGVLFGKYELLEDMPPFLVGGDMVTTVEQYRSFYREVPWRFEAGTPNIADVAAFRSAIEFLDEVGLDSIEAHDRELWQAAFTMLAANPRVRVLVSDACSATSVLPFVIEGVHPHDIATIFDSEGVAIRSGLHCAEPLHRRLCVPATARMSFYLYNTFQDIEMAEKALKKIFKIFSLTP
ncbi:SufS family cysteine desulfurase [Candidatus Uhrbacteria bacterium]|nr:SufS family cysteine desulfurase [Candidatus Uhrbacteria bacterium]